MVKLEQTVQIIIPRNVALVFPDTKNQVIPVCGSSALVVTVVEPPEIVVLLIILKNVFLVIMVIIYQVVHAPPHTTCGMDSCIILLIIKSLYQTENLVL